MDNPTATNSHRHRARVRLSERTPTAHRLGDLATEALLYVTLVFGPWVFGTTEVWSVWTMNVTGYLLGLLWLGKWISRWATGFRPARWGDAPQEGELVPFWRTWLREWPTTLLALLTILLLAFCFTSAINAAGAYDYTTKKYTPLDGYVDWLPHSFDRHRSWLFAWQYLSIALLFWSARDWLLAKTRRERLAGVERANEGENEHSMPRSAAPFLPAKVRRLLWVLCLNGAILAVESLLQRLSGTNRLLWLVAPWFNNDATLQLGPYAYRGNGAQYFNLVWPVCLGFWFSLHLRDLEMSSQRRSAASAGPQTVLLPGIAVMAACPFVSASRLGAIVCALGLVMAAAMFILGLPSKYWKTKIAVVALLLTSLAVAFLGDVSMLLARMTWLFDQNQSGRKDIYAGAHKMAEDFGFLGSGPGTFEPLYNLFYRLNTPVESQVHDDWLETLVTFGSLGLGLILAVLALVGYRLSQAVRHSGTRWLAAFIGLSLAICLTHAKGDFPFQVDSLLRLFVLLCGLGWCLPAFRRHAAESGHA